MRKLDEQTFLSIKKPLYNRFARPKVLAKRFDVSEKTILQVRGSQNYSQYRQNVIAQHPPVTFSLRDEVLFLHELTFKKDSSYVAPSTARVAVEELIRENS